MSWTYTKQIEEGKKQLTHQKTRNFKKQYKKKNQHYKK